MSEKLLVFVHSSDELYGADRLLLDMVRSLPEGWRQRAEVWLPTDLVHPAAPLCHELERMSVTVRHLALPVLRRAYRTPRSLAALAARGALLRRWLVRTRPDVVYFTTSATLLGAPIARWAVRVPCVVGHVQERWSASDARLLAPMARSCHRTLAISTPVNETLPAKLRARTTVVVNATSAPAEVVPLDAHTGPLRFVVASRWNGWKGHRTLFAAWDQAGAPGTLTVLGGPPASGEAVDVPALRRELSDPTSVRVVGEVPDPQPHVVDADVVLVPSDQPEPFGLVAIEAFARGRPVIASDGGGLAEIVTHGLDGWLFPLGDVDALADIFRSLARSAVTTAGAHARTTYEARYTIDRYAEQWRGAAGLGDGRQRSS